ncbi:MAG: hypothetical protein ACRDNS_24160, partial [Trebonia sp.]
YRSVDQRRDGREQWRGGWTLDRKGLLDAGPQGAAGRWTARGGWTLDRKGRLALKAAVWPLRRLVHA